MLAKVTSLDSESITLDLNHELAGKTLNFDVELVKHCPADSMQKVSFGAGCFWGPELVSGEW
jgi:peptide-methionine (S)-S-oxide reductase